MRSIFALCMAAAVTAASVRAAAAAPPTSLELSADKVTYFSNRFIVTGEGNVRVRLSDGTMLSGNLFSMDLKLNRYLVAGNVQLESAGAHELGAAFAGYPDLDRSYFLPAAAAPDRWTYFGLDFTHPQKGRQQPGDAFFIPDLSREKGFVLASGATILPKTNVEFHGSRVYVFGVYVPTHSYVVNFSSNPYYSENAFAGASADVGLPYQASEHAISAFHLRYTGSQKAFLSFDQHFAWNHSFIALSINPLTQEERQTNLIAYDRFAPKFEGRLFTQLTTAQHGIYQPEVASSFENVSLTTALPHSSLQLTGDQYNTSLLTLPPNRNFELSTEHPSDAQLAWTGFDHRIAATPVTFRLRSGVGIAHDSYHCGLGAPCPVNLADPTTDGGFVLDYFGAGRTRVSTIWRHFFGVTLYTSSIRVAKDTFVNATFDKQRQWYSLPHHTDTTSTTLSLSKILGTKLAFLGAFNVQNLGDYYGARQTEFYPPYPTIVTSSGTYSGYSAFRGLSTSRSLTGSAVLTPNPNFNVALTVLRRYDFPGPVPGIFGSPPWQYTAETRIRVAKQILMDVSRTDYFNYGGIKPAFNIQFGP